MQQIPRSKRASIPKALFQAITITSLLAIILAVIPSVEAKAWGLEVNCENKCDLSETPGYDNVYGQLNLKTAILTIKGNGTISKRKYHDALTYYNTNYYGKNISVIFSGANQNSHISLPRDSKYLFSWHDDKTSNDVSYETLILPSNLDTSNVVDMSYMFAYTVDVSPNVANWDTSNVTNMAGMFGKTYRANPNVAQWNTSKVTNMFSMFAEAEGSNPDVSQWDTSNVTDMGNMFMITDIADPDVSNWDTSNVTTMVAMFGGAKSANPNVSRWNTSNVTNMQDMFLRAPVANPDVSQWDVSNVANMHHMFDGARSANPDVRKWKLNQNLWATYMFCDAPQATLWQQTGLAYKGVDCSGKVTPNYNKPTPTSPQPPANGMVPPSNTAAKPIEGYIQVLQFAPEQASTLGYDAQLIAKVKRPHLYTFQWYKNDQILPFEKSDSLKLNATKEKINYRFEATPKQAQYHKIVGSAFVSVPESIFKTKKTAVFATNAVSNEGYPYLMATRILLQVINLPN